jgi:hypothetical protein
MLKLLVKATLVLVVVFLATSAFPAPASQDGPAVKTVMQPDLTLKTVLSQPAVIGNVQSAASLTCQCSCGAPCRTNADCGPGGICRAGITCCATPGAGSDPTNTIFQQRETALSRKGASPIVLKGDCKKN